VASATSALALSYLLPRPNRWLTVGLLMGAIPIYTLAVMHPLVNNSLRTAEEKLEQSPSLASNPEFVAAAQKQLKVWGALHGVRSVLSFAAMAAAVRGFRDL